MVKEQYQFRAEPEMIKLIDEYRGDVPRSALLRRAVMEYMEVHPESNGKVLAAASASAASAKAEVEGK